MSNREPVIELIEPEVAAIYRRMSHGQRMQVAIGMWNSARQMIQGTLRQQNPDWTEEEIQRETAARLSHGATKDVRK